LPPTIRSEHVHDGALLGRRRAVPFRIGHSPPLPGGSNTIFSVAVAAHWGRQINLARNGRKRKSHCGVRRFNNLGG
jgi:hypothetical protein